MPISNPLTKLLQDPNQILIIDGALATNLETLGADLNDPLWSCKTLLEQPSLIRDVHLSYYRAGADIAITASYQASPRGLAEQRGLSETESGVLVRKSVELAKSARQEVLASPEGRGRTLLVAGSVGPYGAYLADGSEYRGDYVVSNEDMKSFHRPRIGALVEAGVDLLAIETIPSIAEIEAVLELLSEEFAETPAWLSCTLKNGTAISDGTPIDQVARNLQASAQVIAIGVNCVPRDLVALALRAFRQDSQKPLLCYPNSGESWDARSKTWGGVRDAQRATWQHLVTQWRTEGARLIGGCCRTGPTDIQAIKDACSNTLTS